MTTSRNPDEVTDSTPANLEDLGEYDLRRPMTPTGTNRVVKHLGGMEYGYLGETFGRMLPG